MNSFRYYLEELNRLGELNIVQEQVSCDLQASAICAMSQRAGGPAVRFDNIKDYPGKPLVGSLFSGPGFLEWPQQKRKMHGRMAIAMDLDPLIHYDEILETVIERKNSHIMATEVSGGPCQEVIKGSKEVDLYEFPFPRLHDKSKGRYLTSHVVLVRDPERGWTNFGSYRLMLAAKDRLVHGGIPRRTRPSHIEQLVAQYAAKGEPLPFAIIIGAPPTMQMAACMSLLEGSDEYGVAGGLGVSPLVLVKAQLSDLLVPADAEIILEGHIYPGVYEEEGPFASPSYYVEAKKNFVYQVETITQRKDPIIPFSAEGSGPSDFTCMHSLLHSAELLEFVRQFGSPVKSITIPVEAKGVLAIVSLSANPVPGIPDRVGHLIFGMSPTVRQVIVVDGDVDSEDLLLAISDSIYKAHYQRDYYISEPDKPLGLTENHDFKSGLTSTMIIDACWRLDREPETIPRRVNFESCFPEEIRQKVINMWNEELGLSPKVLT